MTPAAKKDIADVLYRLAVIFLSGAVGVIFNSIWDHEARIIRIESNRFTTADAQLLVKAVESRVGELGIKMARAETKIDDLRAQIQRLLEMERKR